MAAFEVSIEGYDLFACLFGVRNFANFQPLLPAGRRSIDHPGALRTESGPR